MDPKKWKNAIFGDIFCPCKERAVGSTGVGKNTPLGALGGPGPAGRNFHFFSIFFVGPQNVLKRCPRGLGGPGGPWGALGGPIFLIFPPFFPPLGAPYFSFYTAVISPPISPLKAAALWGTPPGQFHILLRSTWLENKGYNGPYSADTVTLGQQPKKG